MNVDKDSRANQECRELEENFFSESSEEETEEADFGDPENKRPSSSIEEVTEYVNQFAKNRHFVTVINQLLLLEVLKQVFITQDREYERLLDLINNKTPSETLSQAIKQAQSRNEDLKRKYIEIDDNDDNFVEQSTSSFSFQKGMNFVEKFKKARMEKGLKQMDWVTCLSEGKKTKLFSYKNTATLRTQYNKYMKYKN